MQVLLAYLLFSAKLRSSGWRLGGWEQKGRGSELRIRLELVEVGVQKPFYIESFKAQSHKLSVFLRRGNS